MKKILFVFTLSVVLALSARAGWYFEVKTTGESSAGQAQNDMMNSLARTWISADKLKSEFVESKNPVMPAGSYMISTNGGASVALVNPEQKTYAPLDIAGLAGGAMKMMGGMMKITDPKVEKLLDEDGGKMLGQPVRHYKFRTSYNMDMNMVIMKTSSKIETIQEIWAATKIEDAGTSFWKNKNAFSTGDENFDKLIKGEMEKIKGLPLKQVTLTKTTDQNGSVTEMKMIMEVTNLKEQKVADSVFAIPSDYTATSFMPMAAGAAGKSASDGSERKKTSTMDAKGFMDLFKKMSTPPTE